MSKYKKQLEKILEVFPTAKINKARNHEEHIRIGNIDNDIALSFVETIEDKFYLGSIQDKRYSTAYLTHFLLVEKETVPVVFSVGEYKVNNQDSLTQKQLTPQKLNMSGTYQNQEEFSKKLIKEIKKLKPRLSSQWNERGQELTKVLIKLVNQIENNKVVFTEREKDILKAHSSSLGKDFGELLVALRLLKEHGNINISESEKEELFDMFYVDKNNDLILVNVKSEAGSGQSFKAFEKEIIEYSKPLENNKKVALDIMKVLVDKNILGVDKIWKVLENAYALDESENLKKILNQISKEFFCEKKISKENYIPKKSFDEYKDSLMEIFKKNDIKAFGIPKGSNEEDPDVFYQTDKGKEHAILFSLTTIVTRNFPKKYITEIMRDINKDISVVSIKINENGSQIITPEDVEYKFHYWGNYKNLINNYPGYKSIY